MMHIGTEPYQTIWPTWHVHFLCVCRHPDCGYPYYIYPSCMAKKISPAWKQIPSSCIQKCWSDRHAHKQRNQQGLRLPSVVIGSLHTDASDRISPKSGGTMCYLNHLKIANPRFSEMCEKRCASSWFLWAYWHWLKSTCLPLGGWCCLVRCFILCKTHHGPICLASLVGSIKN